MIDPLRDIETYILLAAERKASIKYIFETHFHADFVSGHLDLSKATGAPIVYGPNTETKFPIYLSKDGELFTLGAVSIEVLHTPGHTLESTCYLLRDEQGAAHAVFTGDTLFVNEVGRPDLSSGNLTKEELAAMLYDSLQNKILPLNDDVVVYPAHGPGSSCGKNAGPDTECTIGQQKISNYALNQPSKEAFIKAVTDDLATPPSYFSVNAKINKEGYEGLQEVLVKGLQPLSIGQFKTFADAGVWIVDTREAARFTQGFIPGSVSIGLDGRFAEWAGSLLPFGKPVILVTDPGKEKETLVRLARVGFVTAEGYLDGGFEAWKEAGEQIDLIIDVEADELAMDIPFDENLVVLDVRNETEWADGHVKGAMNIPLTELTDPGNMAILEDHHNIYVHCGGGYRSVIAASLLKRQGYHNLRNVAGGWGEIKKQEKIKIEKDTSVLN